MQTLSDFPYFVLCGASQDDYGYLPAFGRFERIEWPMYSRGDFTRPLRFTGILDLDGSPALAHLGADAWAVVRIDRDDPCEPETREDGSIEPGVVRFASGFVLFRGPRRVALSIFTAYASGASLDAPLLALQDRSGVATTGDYGMAIAGDEGFARAGFCGVAQAGMPEQFSSMELHEPDFWQGYPSLGVACAGVRGTAFAGKAGIAVAESGGRARAADHGVAVSLYRGGFCTVEAGRFGVAVSHTGHGIVIAGDDGVAVANAGAHWLSVGKRGIGVAKKHVGLIDVADGALVVAPEQDCDAVVRLGRNATLICVPDSIGFAHDYVSVFTTCDGELEPGVYAATSGNFQRITDGISPPDIAWQARYVQAEDRAVSPPAPAFPSGIPWWEAALDHDPRAEVVQEPMLAEHIIVLCADIWPHQYSDGREDGQLWLGALWGQGELTLTDGAQCCLVRVQGEYVLGQGRGNAVGFRLGTRLYRGNLRGAVAALRAAGADSALDGHVALAGHGGVARVPSRIEPMPLPPPHPDDIEERHGDIPYHILRGDRTIGRYPSLAIAGDEGFAICDGEAYAGDRGVACVTGLGVASAGEWGVAVCEDGRAFADFFGIAWCRSALDENGRGSGLAAAGPRGIAIAQRDGSRAMAEEFGVAIAMMGAKEAFAKDFGVSIGAGARPALVSGGAYAVVVARTGRVSGAENAMLVAWDAGKCRWIHGVVGQGGLESRVPYVARNGRFEPAPKPFVTQFRRKRRRKPR